MFEKLAYFFNGDTDTINSYVGIMVDRDFMAEKFSVLPHVIDDMPSVDYWRSMAISNARHEAKELNNGIAGAWDI